jgi:GTP-binding protein
VNSRYRNSRFLISVREFRQLPPDEGCEVAFAGRSNAGKSSALNTLTQQRSLARTSKTPGRTQMINFFQVEPGHRLVDLPGYGYAKVPAEIRRHWDRLLQRYLSERKTLRGLFIIMDIRHPLTTLDKQLLEWCEYADLSSHILLTKSDKLSFGACSKTLRDVQHVLKNHYPRASVQLFSALRQIGVKEAHAQLDKWLYDDCFDQ